MRGKLFNLLSIIRKNRITPADAGKTTICTFAPAIKRDHPRGCGENVYVFPCVRNKPGSPPRMRGKQTYMGYRFFNDRITPADAGKTMPAPISQGRRKDHPRGCGENMGYRFLCWENAGSPPRMRGKLFRQLNLLFNFGITPADAGKTRLQEELPLLSRDHPRGCGENRSGVGELGKERGSPPRMRGKPVEYLANPVQAGITPADAGKTSLLLSQFLPFSGSPPRMRGKPQIINEKWRKGGITPADAGKTPPLQAPSCIWRDHPRGCGEN